MPAKRRESPYHSHIWHWDVPRGKIGAKHKRGKDTGKKRIVWEISDGAIYLVCPHCRKIAHIPTGLVYGGEITCMVCPICRVDYSYTLKGLKKKR